MNNCTAAEADIRVDSMMPLRLAPHLVSLYEVVCSLGSGLYFLESFRQVHKRPQ